MDGARNKKKIAAQEVGNSPSCLDERDDGQSGEGLEELPRTNAVTGKGKQGRDGVTGKSAGREGGREGGGNKASRGKARSCSAVSPPFGLGFLACPGDWSGDGRSSWKNALAGTERRP
jgi:hypothetical protein